MNKSKIIRLFKNKYITFLLLGLIAFFTTRTLFTNKIPRTHDFDLHAIRIGNYYLSLKQGQFPPRWAPNSNGGFGYPIFNFTYPLPYLTGAIFFALGLSIESSLNLILILCVLTAVIGVFKFSNLLNKDKITPLLTSLLYVSTPFYLVNIFVRGALGEILFLSLVPWALYYSKKIQDFKHHYLDSIKLSIIIFALLISHSLSAFYIFPIFLIWFLFTNKNKKNIKTLFISSFTGILLASFMLIPMTFEGKYIFLNNHQTITGDGYQNSFIGIRDLIWSDWSYSGFSDTGADGGGSFSKMIGLTGLMSLIMLWTTKNEKNKETKFWSIVFLLATYLTTKYSNIIWHYFLPIRYLTFPFRILGLVTISLIFIYNSFFKNVKSKTIYIVFAIISIHHLVFFAKPIGMVQKTQTDWLQHPSTTDSSNENMPIWFDSFKSVQIGEERVVTNKESEVKIDSWNGSKMNYQINTDSPTTVIQRTAYFPGWQVLVNDQLVDIDYQRSDFPGLISYTIPQGSSKIVVSHTQNTTPRKIGNTLSIVGVILLSLNITKKIIHARKN